MYCFEKSSHRVGGVKLQIREFRRGHDPGHCSGCGFRRLRPGNPIERGQAFRSNAATFSEEGDRGSLPV
jgi:hypothetical protein